MSLTFYFAPMSTASITQAVLAELRVPHETVMLDIDAGDTRRPDFLKINPNGRVPTIVHNGVAIWESAAITMYLGETFGADADLYPAPGPRRGEAMKWIVWSNTVLAAAAGRLSATLQPGADGAVQTGSVDFVEPRRRSDEELSRARADVVASLALLDDALSGKSFLLDSYSLADAHASVLVGWIELMGVDLAQHAGVARWLALCNARPAIAALADD